MGLVLSRMYNLIWGAEEYRILMLGLDNAGKTTALYRLKVCMRRA